MEKETISANVLLAVDPEGNTTDFCANYNSDIDIEMFYLKTNSLITWLKEEQETRLGDIWLFNYHFPDGEPIDKLFNPVLEKEFFGQIRDEALRQGVRPTYILPLRDLIFCNKQGLNPFTTPHEELITMSGYKAVGTRIGLYGTPDEKKFPTCRAVDIGRGALLYDLGYPVGRAAYDSFRQYCADHFFDRGMNTDSIRLYDLHTVWREEELIPHISALNLNFNHYGKDFSLAKLTPDKLFPQDICREGVRLKQYDMRPISECYAHFLTGENLRFNPYYHTFDIAILDQIVRNGYPRDRLSEEWRFICSYTARFSDLADRIVGCPDAPTMERLQTEAKRRAGEFLDRDFPDRRRIDVKLGKHQSLEPILKPDNPVAKRQGQQL